MTPPERMCLIHWALGSTSPYPLISQTTLNTESKVLCACVFPRVGVFTFKIYHRVYTATERRDNAEVRTLSMKLCTLQAMWLLQGKKSEQL